jgi:hypothetical protein
MEDINITPQESFSMITQYVKRVRNSIFARRATLLFWGWLLLITFAGQYILLTIVETSYHFYIWPVLMVLGSVFTSIKENRRTEKIKSYADSFLDKLFISGAVFYFLIAFIAVRQNVSPMPYMFGLTALLLGVVGFTLHFKPLQLGAFVFLAASIASVFLSGSYILIAGAIAVLAGYITPCYMIKKEGEV